MSVALLAWRSANAVFVCRYRVECKRHRTGLAFADSAAEEHLEVPVVPLPNAVVDEGAVVIEPPNWWVRRQVCSSSGPRRVCHGRMRRLQKTPSQIQSSSFELSTLLSRYCCCAQGSSGSRYHRYQSGRTAMPTGPRPTARCSCRSPRNGSREAGAQCGRCSTSGSPPLLAPGPWGH